MRKLHSLVLLPSNAAAFQALWLPKASWSEQGTGSSSVPHNVAKQAPPHSTDLREALTREAQLSLTPTSDELQLDLLARIAARICSMCSTVAPQAVCAPRHLRWSGHLGFKLEHELACLKRSTHSLRDFPGTSLAMAVHRSAAGMLDGCLARARSRACSEKTNGGRHSITNRGAYKRTLYQQNVPVILTVCCSWVQPVPPPGVAGGKASESVLFAVAAVDGAMAWFCALLCCSSTS